MGIECSAVGGSALVTHEIRHGHQRSLTMCFVQPPRRPTGPSVSVSRPSRRRTSAGVCSCEISPAFQARSRCRDCRWLELCSVAFRIERQQSPISCLCAARRCRLGRRRRRHRRALHMLEEGAEPFLNFLGGDRFGNKVRGALFLGGPSAL